MIIQFEIDSEGHIYRDALNLPDTHTLSEAEILTLQQAKFIQWKAFVQQASTIVDEVVTDG